MNKFKQADSLPHDRTKPAAQKIFVPGPQKVKMHRPPDESGKATNMVRRLDEARRQASIETLTLVDQLICDPLQTILSMAELEQRNDYLALIKRILSGISALQNKARAEGFGLPDEN